MCYYKRRKKLFPFSRSYWQYLGVIVLFAVIISISYCSLIFTRNVGIKIDDSLSSESESSDYNFDRNSLPIWIRISDSVHVYSAHFDPRIKYGPYSPHKTKKSFINPLTLIRVIGIKRFPPKSSIISQNPLNWLRIKEETYFNQDYECKLFLGENIPTLSSTLLTYHVVEEGIKKFAACFFNCYFNLSVIPDNLVLSNAWISLQPKNVAEYPIKLIKVNTALSDKERSNKKKISQNDTTLSICIRPLFSLPNKGDFDLLQKLVQFISYYVALGVDSFTFYELSTFPQVRNYLRELHHFRHDFRLHVLQWNNLPTGNTSELWDFGSIAALNDCLYRNMRADHVIFVDLDEFIVPQNESHNSLRDLINYLEEKADGTSLPPSQILIRNTFFCSEFCLGKGQHQNRHNNNRTVTIKALSAITFPIATCTTRTKRVWNVKVRSKFIVRPRNIISVGHHTSHNFWISDHEKNKIQLSDPRMTRYTNSFTADVNAALLNHYRDCAPISTKKQPIFNRFTVKDDKIMRILSNKKFHLFLPYSIIRVHALHLTTLLKTVIYFKNVYNNLTHNLTKL